MNICFLSETSAWGGAEAHTVGLADTLVERGHTVSIVPLGRDVFEKVSSRFKVCRVSLPRPVKQLRWGECTALMRGLPTGVGVLVRWGMQVGSLRLDVAARAHFRRYLAIEHSAALLPPPASRRYCFGLLPGVGLWRYQLRALWYLRSVVPHRVVCVTDSARRQMIRAFRVPAGKVVTVANGIDCDRFRPDADQRAAARRQWGVPGDALVFGSIGRLHVEKDLDLAVEALGILAAQHPDRDPYLVLVGDGPEREALGRTARQAGVAGRVVFAGFTSRPWEAYAGMDVFLLPSRDEALPLALLEAMASGCCPIAMGVGGVPEVLADPALGWLVPPGDRAAFLAAMDAVRRADAARRAAVGRAARAHIVAHFDARTQYAALADLIEQGLTTAPRTALIERTPRSLETCR